MNSPSTQKARSGYSKGELRYQKILESAEKVLITHGYHNLTLRKISADAGVSMGNLQYYFPNKDELIRALLDSILRDYTGRLEQYLDIEDPQEQFEKVIAHVINDLNNQRTTILFPELWSLSNHDQTVAELLDNMYEPYWKLVSTVIQRLNPDLSPEQAYRLSAYITSAIEGFTMFLGHNKPWESETETFIQMSIKSFGWLIREGDI